MKTAAIAMSLLVVMLVTPLGFLKKPSSMDSAKVSTEVKNPDYKKQEIPVQNETPDAEVPKTSDVEKTITLEAKNMVVLRGPVTTSSVGTAMKKLRDVSRRISKDTPILLVLDTPGGSIPDGLELIDFATALPQKVHTITLFAASMGFQIAQNLNTRYIIRNGTLMSHRASVQGLGGQVKGELETRYKMIRRVVDSLDFKAYSRMGMAAKDYENLVLNEYWVYGFDAVKAKAADEQILVRCGASLDGSEDVPFDTMLGRVVVTFSACPLIKAPEKIDMSGLTDPTKEKEVQQVFNLALEDKTRFVHEYIVNDRFYDFFK